MSIKRDDFTQRVEDLQQRAYEFGKCVGGGRLTFDHLRSGEMELFAKARERVLELEKYFPRKRVYTAGLYGDEEGGHDS